MKASGRFDRVIISPSQADGEYLFQRLKRHHQTIMMPELGVEAAVLYLHEDLVPTLPIWPPKGIDRLVVWTSENLIFRQLVLENKILSTPYCKDGTLIEGIFGFRYFDLVGLV